MKRTLAGILAAIVLSSPAAAAAEEPPAWLVGAWRIKFANGVEELCVLGKDQTASVWEPLRQSAGKIEVRDGHVLAVYDDGRLERWAPVGRRAVVEHWASAADYPRTAPVLGIAEANHDGQAPEPRPGQSGEQLRREANAKMLVKAFVDDLRRPLSDDEAGRLRTLIDPRYLKKHNLDAGPFPLRRVVAGAILAKALVDPQTVFLFVETDEAEKEVWLLRLTDVNGQPRLLPPPPDPQIRAFTAWTFRWKL